MKGIIDHLLIKSKWLTMETQLIVSIGDFETGKQIKKKNNYI